MQIKQNAVKRKFHKMVNAYKMYNGYWLDILLSLIHCVLDVYSMKTNCAELIPFISTKILENVDL